jgi:hypothetical protein
MQSPPRSWALYFAGIAPLFAYMLGRAFGDANTVTYFGVMAIVGLLGLGLQAWLRTSYALPREAL